MIKNERQYRITKAQAERFSHTLEQLAKAKRTNGETHPLLLKAEEDALRSQLADLQAQIEEYDALRSGRVPLPDLASFIDLPNTLVKARIAMGLSQRELAHRLGLKEQQIQRYEATGYISASLARIQEVIQGLGVNLDDATLKQSVKPSCKNLFRRLKEVGIDYVGRIYRWTLALVMWLSWM